MSNKIEGVPEGWEIVRVGMPTGIESYVDDYGNVRVITSGPWPFMPGGKCIVRKIEPPKPIDPGEGWRLLEPHEAKQKGDECNFIINPYAKWLPVDVCSMKLDHMVYRRRIEPPKPAYVPWTFETCPLGVHVECLDARKKGMITGAGDDGARVGATVYSYEKLLSDWQLRNGTPCGTIEVQK